MSADILLVEDDDSLREVLTFNLTDGGFRVEAVASGEAALERYDSEKHAVVLTDLRMPGIDGLELLRRIKADHPLSVVVMMTAYGSLEAAVQAMQDGAFHYVEKPVNTRTLLAILARAVEYGQLGRENRRLQAAVSQTRPDRLIVSTSPAMNEVLRLVDKVAESDATVLIRGESGTGKELIARAIHARSARSGAPFVTINCAAIPADLLESILFGHKKGAFTGATRASEGKFVVAGGGTLFLDEIGEMSSNLQSKLLRVLQDGEVDVVGSNKPIRVDVRIVAATHRNLEKMVEDNLFRRDLFYRLNVIPLAIPPLRQRREDIPVLLRHFIRKHRPNEPIHVDRAVDDSLLEHDWPGNVRELENVAKRMVLLADTDRLTVQDLPGALRQQSERSSAAGADGSTRPLAAGLPFRLPEDGLDLVDHERRIIEAVLDKLGGNQSAAARYLNIPRHVLLYRMEKFGLK